MDACDADVIVFDLETIKEDATFLAPKQLSSGRRHVIVDANRIADARPGKPVRRQVK